MTDIESLKNEDDNNINQDGYQPKLISVPSLVYNSKSFYPQSEIVRQTGKSCLTISFVKHFEKDHSCDLWEPERDGNMGNSPICYWYAHLLLRK